MGWKSLQKIESRAGQPPPQNGKRRIWEGSNSPFYLEVSPLRSIGQKKRCLALLPGTLISYGDRNEVVFLFRALNLTHIPVQVLIF